MQQGPELQPIEVSSPTQAGEQHRGSRRTHSGYKGVYPYGRRWETVAWVNKRRKRLSVHETAEEAARAYDQYLIAQAGGDPSAAVNFPPDKPQTPDAGTAFVEQFASTGKLTDLDWQRWQQSPAAAAAPAGPLPVLPDGGVRISASTPLIDRPAKQLYRRDSVPALIAPPEPAATEPVEPIEPTETIEHADDEHVH